MEWKNQDTYNVIFGTLSGGIGAEIGGGNFFVGAATGLAVSYFNHLMHKLKNYIDPKTKKAEELAKKYKTNENRIVVKSIAAELLLESTEPGDFTLKALREELVEVYGDSDQKQLNEVYSQAVDVYKEINSQLGKNGFSTTLKIALAGRLGSDVIGLHASNKILEVRIKSLDLNIYHKYIRPDLAPQRGSFGGGGTKSNFYK